MSAGKDSCNNIARLASRFNYFCPSKTCIDTVCAHHRHLNSMVHTHTYSPFARRHHRVIYCLWCTPTRTALSLGDTRTTLLVWALTGRTLVTVYDLGTGHRVIWGLVTVCDLGTGHRVIWGLVTV